MSLLGCNMHFIKHMVFTILRPLVKLEKLSNKLSNNVPNELKGFQTTLQIFPAKEIDVKKTQKTIKIKASKRATSYLGKTQKTAKKSNQQLRSSFSSLFKIKRECVLAMKKLSCCGDVHLGKIVWKDQGRVGEKKFGPFLDLCVSSLRRGHANLLCIVPILSDVPEGTIHAQRLKFIKSKLSLS